MKKPIIINGVAAYIDNNGMAHLKLEDVARGLGFTEIAASGNETVRWRTVKGYLEGFGFIATSCDTNPQQASKDAFIPENIFYRLAMKAKNANAEAFQIKVADEILPTIRKHGAYMTSTTIENLLDNPDTIIQLATTLKHERQERERLEQAAKENQPLVELAELWIQNEESVKVGDFAHSLASKGYDIGQKRLFEKLRQWGFMYARGTEPTQRAIEQGILEVKQGIKNKPDGEAFAWRTPYLTTKGQMYVIDRLKKEGLL